MPELADGSVDLVVTSPPYWQIKDYGCEGQVGARESLHVYLHSLAAVWRECLRVLAPGGRLCVNIGDQFARASLYGRFHVIPLHAETVCAACAVGFDFLGSIIWQKKTTMNTSGGAVVMGSFPYPPNGIVELDYEHIHVFRRQGTPRKPAAEVREASALTKDEWKVFFSGHWNIGGARKRGHEAPFPEEVPRRLIRMFSFVGDTVLDPFMGTGTTARAALSLGRHCVGYEINPRFVAEAAQALGRLLVEVREAGTRTTVEPPSPYTPQVPDILPPAPAAGEATPAPHLHRVVRVNDDCSLGLDTGERVVLGGIRLVERERVLEYLRGRILRRQVFLREATPAPGGALRARVVLKNRIPVNAYLVRAGLAVSVTDGGTGDGPAP
jgi:DNA modification methylase